MNKIVRCASLYETLKKNTHTDWVNMILQQNVKRILIGCFVEVRETLIGWFITQHKMCFNETSRLTQVPPLLEFLGVHCLTHKVFKCYCYLIKLHNCAILYNIAILTYNRLQKHLEIRLYHIRAINTYISYNN